MKVAIRTLSAVSMPSFILGRPVQVALVAIAIVFVGFYLLFHGQLNALTALLFLFPLGCVTLLSMRLGIACTFAYLLLLGDLRRLGDLVYGFPKTDLLILVPSLIAVFLATPILLRLTLDAPIVKAMLAFLCIMALEIVNPRQGGIGIGLSATLFWIVPTLWFWIGLRYGEPLLVNLLLFRVILPLACAAALLGYAQTFVGFLPWEQAWIDVVKVHFRALGLANGAIRAFGFSVNGEDFGHILAIGCVISSGAVFRGRRIFGLIFLLIFPMLILTSIRNVFVKLIFTMALQFAGNSARQAGGSRKSIMRLIGFLVLASVIISFAASRVKDTGNAAHTSTTQAALSHEAGGLTHVDAKHSTLGLHGFRLLRGFSSGFLSPIGYGLGSSTIGGGEASGSSSSQTDKDNAVGTSEFDIGDSFSALGFPGGFLYLYIVYLVLRMMWNICVGNSSEISISAAGVVLCGLFAWVSTPGGYSIPPLFWFIIGSAAMDQKRQTSFSLLRDSAFMDEVYCSKRDTKVVSAEPKYKSSPVVTLPSEGS